MRRASPPARLQAPLIGLLLLLALAATPVAAEAPRVLPVLSEESGRVEALLLLDEGSRLESLRALDRVLPPASATGRGLRVRLGRTGPLTTDLSLDAQPGLALLCRGNIGLAAALGSLGDQCLLADVGGNDLLFGQSVARRVGVETIWHSVDDEFDVRFGLSWLEGARFSAGDGLGFALPERTLLPTPLLLAADTGVESLQVSLSGTRMLGDSGWIQLDGSSTSSAFVGSLFGAPLQWDSSSLSLAGGIGSISGRITGRLIEIPQLDGVSEGHSSFDVDLGVSWQTPWRAKLTVGARNLLGQPDVSQWPLSSLPRQPESDTRMPYVRYHQDL